MVLVREARLLLGGKGKRQRKSGREREKGRRERGEKRRRKGQGGQGSKLERREKVNARGPQAI